MKSETMSTFNTKMFDSIKNALQKNTTQSNTKNIMKFEQDKTYTVRLVPNVSEPEKTFFHYYTYDWKSFGTGQYTSVLSPATFGQKCPITDAKYKLIRNGDEEERAKANLLRRNEKWLINAYVVDDPTTPENNGTVKIIRYGKQLHKIISDAIDGEGSDDFGARIFDLSENGVNLKIKCEKQGDYITYVSSKFSMPRKIDGLSNEKMDDIYNSTYDLTSIIPTKSQEELMETLDEHFFAKKTLLHESKTYSTTKEVQDLASDKDPVSISTPKTDSSDDENIQKLLADLDA